jgi:hypothetical protein
MAYRNISPIEVANAFGVKNKKYRDRILKIFTDAGISSTDYTQMKVDDEFMNGDKLSVPFYNKSKTGYNTITVKISTARVQRLIESRTKQQLNTNVHKIVSGKLIDIKFSIPTSGVKKSNQNQILRFQRTDKLNLTAPGVRVSDAAKTAMVELGTAWVMYQAIQKNKTWNDYLEIKEDVSGPNPTWPELVKIWTLIGKDVEGPSEEWLETFWQSNKAFLRKISNPTFSEFTRGSQHANNTNYVLPGMNSDSFMDWISDFVRDNYGISKKDTWNPADIWLIKNERKWRSEIISNCKWDGPKSSPSATVNLMQLNEILRRAYHQKEIIGISLKKKTNRKQMVYQAVNTNERFFADRESNQKFRKHYAYSKSQCYLDVDNTKGQFSTQDTVIFCNRNRYSFQVKANTSNDRTGSALKYEASDKVYTGARLGKAKVDDVLDLMKNPYKLDMDSSKTSYPFSPEEFSARKNEYKQKLEILDRAGTVLAKVGTITVDQALDNIEYMFRAQPWVANSKCQQITWLSMVMSLSSEERDNFMADLVFMAKKEGRKYGPFGKIF